MQRLTPASVTPAAWVLTCLAALLAGQAVALAPAELARALPWPAPLPGAGSVLGGAALAAAAAAALLLLLAAGFARAGGRERALAGLILVHPLVLAGLWLLVDAQGVTAPGWAAGGGLAAGAAALAFVDGDTRRRGRPWSRNWLLVDAAMVIPPVVIGLALGMRPGMEEVGRSVLLYPAYAFVQLSLFLALPVRRLRLLGVGPRASAAAAAVVFGLLHWPHPLVALLTTLGLAAWALAWQQGRPLWQLAVVMGLAATAVTQFLPDTWHGHMQVGPAAARQLAVADLAGSPGRMPAGTFLAAAYPAAVGRAATTADLDRWQDILDRERRIRIAWQMHLSEEYAGLAAEGLRPAPPPLTADWSDLAAPWPATLAALADGAPAGPRGRDAFLVHAYATVLGRETGREQRSAWHWDLDEGDRARLAEVLLQERAALVSAPPRADALPALRLPPS